VGQIKEYIISYIISYHTIQHLSIDGGGRSLVFVDDGVEELAVPPAGGEVVAADALVAVRHPLGPEQQLLLGRHVLRLAVDLNV